MKETTYCCSYCCQTPLIEDKFPVKNIRMVAKIPIILLPPSRVADSSSTGRVSYSHQVEKREREEKKLV